MSNGGQSRFRVAIFENGKSDWVNEENRNHPYFEELFKS